MSETKKLLYKFLNQTCTNSEIDLLSQSIKTDEGNQDVSEVMDDIWNDLEYIKTPYFQYNQCREEAESLLTKIETRKKIFRGTKYLKYAIAIVFILSSTIGMYKIFSKSTSVDEYCQVHVKNGEQKEIRLPDNSLISLNSGSYLRYPVAFSKEERIIELNGEAYIDVTRDEKKPFIVRLSSGDIKVLGTSFNVKSYDEDNELIISVQTGKVQLHYLENQILLKKDDQLVVNKNNGDFYKRKENGDLVKSWTKGILYFNKTPIRTVFKDLERVYACKIELESKNELPEIFLYGQHDNKSLESVLNSIKYTTGLKYRKEVDQYIFYKN